MSRIDHLDITIRNLIVLNVNNKLVRPTEIPTGNNFDIPEIEDALDKLVELGYAGKNPEEYGYYLKFNGRLFYENIPKCFKGRPFKYQSFVNKSNTLWTTTKTIGIIINSVALILIGVWTVVLTNKSNEFENKSISQQRIIEEQNKKIGILNDSLLKQRNNVLNKNTASTSNK